MFELAPSILSADFANLSRDIEKIKKAGAGYVHADVMDGHFVPNITIGAPVVKAIRKATDMAVDVHLMISKPEQYIDDFIKAGADIITVHFEAEGDTACQLERIRAAGIKAGVSIKPKTPVSEIKHLLRLADIVLIMNVEPGFGGQGFIPDTLSKITEAKNEIKRQGLDCLVETDGGATLDNISDIVRAGADIAVAGSAVFASGDVDSAVKQFYCLARCAVS